MRAVALLLILGLALLAAPLAGEAQPEGKVWRIRVPRGQFAPVYLASRRELPTGAARSRLRGGSDALCESFFATLECELLDRERFRTPAEARGALFDYIEGWYNPHRRHSALGYESPLRYERLHAAGARRAPAPEKSRAVQPPGSTFAKGGVLSRYPPKPALPPVPPTVVEHEPTVSTPAVRTSAIHRPRNRGNFSRSGSPPC